MMFRMQCGETGVPGGRSYVPNRPDTEDEMLLERLLDGLAVSVEPFDLCRVEAGERLDLGRHDHPTVHYVLRGTASLHAGRDRALALATSEAAIVPAGFTQSAEGEGLVMACGAIHATTLSGRGVFDFLDRPIRVGGADDAGFSRAFEALLEELSQSRPGAEALSRALMQQCLVAVLRRYCASGECEVPWLTALEDERLGRALQAMLDGPEAPHSVESLADSAGMSRSAFAEHFARAFGRGPIDFLKELRLRRAASLLSATDTPVKSVGAAVGFTGRSYFSRAFRAQFGQSPAAYRAAVRPG